MNILPQRIIGLSLGRSWRPVGINVSQEQNPYKEQVKGERTLNELAGCFEVHPTQVVQWKQRLLAGAVEVFNGSVERDAVEEAALRDRLYQEIGQMKVELDWLKKKHELLA